MGVPSAQPRCLKDMGQGICNQKFKNFVRMKPQSVISKFFHYFNLESELDSYDRIHESIVKDVVFRGTNLWILMFAIIIASVGLNMNSTAVIIGAMLISPLMGPINGMGYSIATYNMKLFKISLKNYGFAVLAGLFASTLYFSISPISTAHSELLSRTTPTIYDVIIALFGGLAGIVAISSKQKGNVIPGVAIATALMPPLCTAGYGLATGQFNFFFGAFYLFTINTVFIGISSVAISQILKFPIIADMDVRQKKSINRWISTVIIVVLLPSIYFGYRLVQNEKFNLNASRYISNVSSFEGNYLLRNNIDVRKKIITLTYGGVSLTEKQKEAITQKASNFDLDDAKILIEQGLALNSSNETDSEVIKLRSELTRLNMIIRDKDAQIDSISRKRQLGKTLLLEIQAFFPKISSCSYAETFQYKTDSSQPDKTTVVFFGITSGITPAEKKQISNWLNARLNQDDIKVFWEYVPKN